MLSTASSVTWAKNTESRIKAYMAQIAEVHADGDHTVRIKISGPNSEFPILFSSARAGIIPEGHTDFENAVGTGPIQGKGVQARHSIGLRPPRKLLD